jgi:F0F1-type ATP synthase membrane subunit b/b'
MLTLPPDFTFVIQLTTFLVLLVVLRRLFFAPFLEVLEDRSDRTSGDIEKAATLRAEVESQSARLDAELAKARSVANAEVDAVRAATREEADRLFRSAHDDAAARLVELRGQVQLATAEARGALAGDVQVLADAMVTAVLGNGGAA